MDKELLDFQQNFDDINDALSTHTTSLNTLPYEEDNNSNARGSDSPSDSMIDGSRRIRKKRNAYHKIDDDTRLKLFEAVQKGETLKSAAKRLNVNYSSAKSIFHIFRKEGRILKKNNNEKDFGYGFQGFPSQEINMQGHMGMNPNQGFMGHPNMNQNFHMGNNIVRNPLADSMNRNPHMSSMSHGHPHMPQQYQRPIYPGSTHPHMHPHQNQHPHHGQPHNQHPHHNPHMDRPAAQQQEEISQVPSPLAHLADNFSDLLKLNTATPHLTDIVNNKKTYVPIYESRSSPRNLSPTSASMSSFPAMPFISHTAQPGQIPFDDDIMPQITLATKPSQSAALVSPANKLDNYYLNYSNSPLSGNVRMMKEGSESGSNRYINGEFDSFSEMMNAFQGQSNLVDAITKGGSAGLPKLPVMTPTMATEGKKGIDESPAWGGTLENAAMDTFKSFVDAQMVLNNAFTKANMLHNLVNLNKPTVDESPTAKFMNFQSN